MDIKRHYFVWNGKIRPQLNEKNLKQVIVDFIKTCKEGQLVEVIIRKHSGKRTNPMNRYLHWIFGFIASEIGEDRETIKSAMKEMFLKRTLDNGLDYILETRNLSVDEMTDFIEDIRKFWFDFIQLDIPTPDQVEVR